MGNGMNMDRDEGTTSLAKLRGQSDLQQTQKSTKPKMKDENEEESEGGTETGHEGVMGTETQKHLAKHHKKAMKLHKTMAKHHEGLADAHHEMAEHHETQLGQLTEPPRATSNY